MAIPQQVQEDAKKAEDYIKSQSSGMQPEPGSTGNTTQAPSGEGVPTGDEGNPTGNSSESVGVSSTQPSPSQGEQTTPTGDTPPEYKRLMQQHRTLQGMYNSMDARFRESETRNNQLAQQMEEMRSAFTTAQTAQPQAAQPSQPVGLSAEEQGEYSPKFFNMMERWLHSYLQPIHQQLQSLTQVPQVIGQINDQVQSVAANQQDSALRQFFVQLEQVHPDWEQINDSVQFGDWLQQVDPMAGVTRQWLIDDARTRLDWERAVAIFAEFKRSAGVGGTPTNQVTNNNSVNEQATVLPSKRAQQSTSSKSDVVFTKQDLLKLYEDERHGVYKGKEDEFRKREVEIVNAINNNRYV